MARVLDTINYPSILKEFEASFLALFHHQQIELNHTPKVHLITDHIAEYFQKTGRTFRWTSGEYVETLHQALRMSEERHRLQTKAKHYGTKRHRLNLSKSMYIYNFKSFGFIVKKEWNSKATTGEHMYANFD